MKICFYGVGGVGGYFGTLITERFKHEHQIYFIARGKHKEAICANGLTLKKSGGEEVLTVSPALCSSNINDLPVCDIIVLSVKSYDLENAAKELNKIAHPKTIVLPLLNGVDIPDRIRQHYKTGIVLPSCVYVGTHIESPGVIYQKGGNCKILTGKDPIHREFHPELLLSLFTSAGVDIVWDSTIEASIWTKYMFIAAYGLVCACFSKTLGEVMENEELSHFTKSIMHEINSIAKQLNLHLAPDVVEMSYQKAKQFPFEAKTSFQRDIELKGKINEGDLFGGTIIRFGVELKVPTPVTKQVYGELLEKLG